jgi:hypothetical protein
MTWTERILEFPVRAAAVDEFLRDLRARGSGDLNAVLTTLNEGGLCREVVRHWTRNGWIVVAPNTPLLALTGPAFDRDLTLSDFCGEIEILEEPAESLASASASDEEDGQTHDDS